MTHSVGCVMCTHPQVTALFRSQPTRGEVTKKHRTLLLEVCNVTTLCLKIQNLNRWEPRARGCRSLRQKHNSTSLTLGWLSAELTDCMLPCRARWPANRKTLWIYCDRWSFSFFFKHSFQYTLDTKGPIFLISRWNINIFLLTILDLNTKGFISIEIFS